MNNSTTISPLAIQTHDAARGFRQDRSMDKARGLVRAYFRLLGSVGGDATAYELSGVELDAVNQAASMTHRPVQAHRSEVTV